MTALRGQSKMASPEATMKPRAISSPLLLLALAAPPVWPQTVPATDRAAPARPLNLSLPRDVLRSSPQAIGGTTEEDAATRNVRPETADDEKGKERLPYGTGYEARQRGVAADPLFGGGAGSIHGGGAAGAGGGMGGGAARGGMGRGR